MILLAIDTATECCSAALWVDGKMFHEQAVKPRLHAELILPMVDSLLAQAKVKKTEIQGIVVGQGPGAFTGVRIGVGVAQGLALALDIPVVPVSNLKTLAYSAYHAIDSIDKKTILVATDARMKEVYSAKYAIKGKQIKQLSDETVSKPSDVDLTNIDAFIGSGFSVYPALQEYANSHKMNYETNVYSQAKDMLLMAKDDFLSNAEKIDLIEPVYLRDP